MALLRGLASSLTRSAPNLVKSGQERCIDDAISSYCASRPVPGCVFPCASIIQTLRPAANSINNCGHFFAGRPNTFRDFADGKRAFFVIGCYTIEEWYVRNVGRWCTCQWPWQKI